MGLLLGIDLGTSAVKVSLVDSATGKLVAYSPIPESEIPRYVERAGWCEQDPNDWWDALLAALNSFTGLQLSEITHIGIAYQMHGLVLVDEKGNPVRRSIIWSDGRATALGDQIGAEMGASQVSRLLNQPGNFTAAKLRWVRDNDPDAFARAKWALLPGDFLALKLTGEATTTSTGLSEMIAWDYESESPSTSVWNAADGGRGLMPEVRPILGIQARVSAEGAEATGLAEGIPITYRAGDQPNNALSLNVLNPGEVAATAGTSGVLYGVTDQIALDPQERVNTFLHVNHQPGAKRLGVLLCVNGAGGFYSWVRKLTGSAGFPDLNQLAEQSPPGANGLAAFPYGNGAERSLGNRYLGASLSKIDVNVHSRSDVARAAQEGIVFALRYGFDVMRGLGMSPRVIRAGTGNMFKSRLFCEIFTSVIGCDLELYDTDGSMGAARGAGLGGGVYRDFAEAFTSLEKISVFGPSPESAGVYEDLYSDWKRGLEGMIEKHEH